MPTTTSTAPCTPVVVQVRRQGGLIALQRRGEDGEVRRVRSAATAASLVDAWTAPALTGLDWLDAAPKAPRLAPETPPVAPEAAATAPKSPPVGPEAPPEPPPRVLEPPGRPVEASRRVDPVEAGLWTVAARGLAGAHATLGTGLDISWRQTWGAWRAGPSLRAHLDRQAGDFARAGANGYEFGLGGRAGRRFAVGDFGFGPEVAVHLAYRHVDPTDLVGQIPCQPETPCSVGEPLPEHAAPYHAFAAWAEVGVAADWWPSEDFGVGVGAGFSVAPGFVTSGAPEPVEPEPLLAVREAPAPSRWRASVQVELHWGAP